MKTLNKILIPGSYGVAVKVALFNLAATLFVGLLGVTFVDAKSGSGNGGVIFVALLAALTFPANLFAGSVGGVLFLNPLVWAAVAYVIHSFKVVQVVPNDTTSATESTEHKKFDRPPS